MKLLALLGVLALAAQSPDTWRSAALQVELPRPFDDWVFDAEAERGTTTVIFHPRSAPLGDHLWGVLVVTPWGGPPNLAELADRRLMDTWRRTFGSSYRLLGRDTLRIGGAPAVVLRMTGSIDRAVLEVEEYVVARGNDLILLQLRYPRGVPRDSIAAGYDRVLRGLRLGPATAGIPALDRSGAPARAAARPIESGVSPRSERGLLIFEIPASLRAITAGTLVADVTTGAERIMRYRPMVDDSVPLYAVGRFTETTRTVGRLTVRLWRSPDAVVPVSDAAIDLLARGWRGYWTAFGPVPLAELQIVETDWPLTRGAPGIVFIGADADDYVLLRELARTWWGGFLRHEDLSVLIDDALPAWSPVVAGAAFPLSDTLAAAVARGRIEAGEPRFREALRTLAAATRNSSATNSSLPFLPLLPFSPFLPFCEVCQQNR